MPYLSSGPCVRNTGREYYASRQGIRRPRKGVCYSAMWGITEMCTETEYPRGVHKTGSGYVITRTLPLAWRLSEVWVNSLRLGLASTKVQHLDRSYSSCQLPWELLYADDLAIIDITSTDTQNRLESWQKVLTGNGLKSNVAKTEHLPTMENPLPMTLNGEELKNVDHFKYLGSVIDKDGTIDKDVDLRVQLGCIHGQTGENWPEYSMTGRFPSGSNRGFMTPFSDRLWRMEANVGQWRWSTRGRLLQRRWGCFVGSSECRDENTCETRTSDAFYILHLSTRLCAVAVFVGLDMSRDETQTTSPAVMNLTIPGTRRRGRPKKTWHQQIKDDMTGVGVTQDVALDRNEWRRKTRPTPRR